MVRIDDFGLFGIVHAFFPVLRTDVLPPVLIVSFGHFSIFTTHTGTFPVAFETVRVVCYKCFIVIEGLDKIVRSTFFEERVCRGKGIGQNR